MQIAYDYSPRSCQSDMCEEGIGSLLGTQYVRFVHNGALKPTLLARPRDYYNNFVLNYVGASPDETT
jgi:hypothetical protein